MKMLGIVSTLAVIWALASAPAQAGDMRSDLLSIEHGWARVHYQTPKDAQAKAVDALVAKADALVRRYPGRAEPLIWDAIVLGTSAGVHGGLGALGTVRHARDLLLQAEKIDPRALQGSAYTSLGALYYKVPGWPLGFGDDDKAAAFLKKALAINPAGLDSNYFYADFLYGNGHYARAADYAHRALHAAPRPDRPVADAGRRAEVKALLSKIRARLTQADAGRRTGGGS